MLENGYVNLGVIGTAEDPDNGVINVLTDEQKKAVRDYVETGLDKPIVATIPVLSDTLTQGGYKTFGEHQFVQLNVVGNNIRLLFPLTITEDIDIPEQTISVTTVAYSAILTITR